MLLIFPFVLIASFFGRVAGGNIIYVLCTFWSDAWMFLTGIHHSNIYESKPKTSEHYIFVSNHISYVDIPVILKSVRHHNIRILAKSELSKIPIFGFIYKHAVVSVDRKDADQRAKSIDTLISILKKNISIFICPEGTFNETHKPLKDFYDGAFKVAIETQTPIKPILFLDTYDRLNYKSIFSLTPGRSRSVFLEETNTADLSMEDVPLLKQKVFKQMEDGLIRYNATWIQLN